MKWNGMGLGGGVEAGGMEGHNRFYFFQIILIHGYCVMLHRYMVI